MCHHCATESRGRHGQHKQHRYYYYDCCFCCCCYYYYYYYYYEQFYYYYKRGAIATVSCGNCPVLSFPAAHGESSDHDPRG